MLWEPLNEAAMALNDMITGTAVQSHGVFTPARTHREKGNKKITHKSIQTNTHTVHKLHTVHTHEHELKI